jgi:hypothetical protein
MSKIKILVLKKEFITDLLKFSLFLSLAILAPFLHQQWLTGTIVNALLFLSVVLLGRRPALLLALAPGAFALAVGLLPALLLPFVPLIILGNIILVLVFDFFRKSNFSLALILAAVLKFSFLAGLSFVFADLFFENKAILAPLFWPQLITASSGGLVAYIFLRFKNKQVG